MSDDDTPTIDADEIDLSEYDVESVEIEGASTSLGNSNPGRAVGQIPSQRVLIDSNNAQFGNWNSPQPNPNSGAYEVEIPDLAELGLEPIDTESLYQSYTDRRREEIERKTWEALFEVAELSDNKWLDGSGRGEFTELLTEACERLHKQGGDPEDAYLFMNKKTKGYVHDWMDEIARYNTPTEQDYNPATIQVMGINFQILISPHPEANQIVMVGDEVHAAPHSVPCVVIDKLPIGLEIRLEIDGEDNNIVIDQ